MVDFAITLGASLNGFSGLGYLLALREVCAEDQG